MQGTAQEKLLAREFSRLVMSLLGMLPYRALDMLAWLAGPALKVYPTSYLWLVRRIKLI